MGILKNTRFLALAVALTIGATGGCHHAQHHYWDYSEPNSDDDDADGELLLAAVLLGAVAVVAIPLAIVEATANNQAPAPPASHPPLAVRGQLLDAEGRPLAGATLVVRAASGYSATPEKLPAVTMQTGMDGSYALPMVKANALCVDFSAAGKRPERRWFVALVRGSLKGLPADQREIIFVSPSDGDAKVAPLFMTADK
jgi:hypothetical protein